MLLIVSLETAVPLKFLTTVLLQYHYDDYVQEMNHGNTVSEERGGIPSSRPERPLSSGVNDPLAGPSQPSGESATSGPGDRVNQGSSGGQHAEGSSVTISDPSVKI